MLTLSPFTWALFMMARWTFLGFKILTTIHCHYKAWKSQAIFKYIYFLTPISFIWMNKTIYTQDGLRLSKSWGNYHFWANYPRRPFNEHQSSVWLPTKGAFTPDANEANKSRYSCVVGRLNILRLLSSFTHEIHSDCPTSSLTFFQARSFLFL